MNHSSPPLLAASSYDPAQCKMGVLHIGYGAFHRAHQAVYFDMYMDQVGDLDWGIGAINLRAADSDFFDMQRNNGDGYVLKTISETGDTNYDLLTPHVNFYDWSISKAETEQALAAASVHMATITVTESGYYLNETGTLDTDHPIIAAELATDTKSSIYAYLETGLMHRIAAGAGPITILCCDNIRSNGKMLATNFDQYLVARGNQPLRDWIADNATFPCSMVDRITPQPTPELSHEIEQMFHRKNDPSIMAEDFIQWVIEDNFAGPKPALDKVGVIYTDNVDIYEETKIRILNGGHTCLTYLGALQGHQTFDQALRNPDLHAHFVKYQTQEVLPAITLRLPFDKITYLNNIEQRFLNQYIGDTIERICADGFNKFPVFILPTLQGCFEQGITPIYGIKSIASWYVFARRTIKGLLTIRYKEPFIDQLSPLLEDGAFKRFATTPLLWGDLPRNHPEFISILEEQIEEVEKTWPM
ncbi:D-arabinitol 4-dehydrogenase [Amylibacter marinus]|uniref:D-arabinitol 4-dehydrogenase n=1 Tax=Amylibacter marinus TaxID=1475483 RepID=A0ABQ5VSV5_9RHOB|nr:mannitol dehydrogenase family protein [Amylibacter marinus]GLQ34234.1 D-arabinitol 4-dehydrogenase [Amylibacter marinus]